MLTKSTWPGSSPPAIGCEGKCNIVSAGSRNPGFTLLGEPDYSLKEFPSFSTCLLWALDKFFLTSPSLGTLEINIPPSLEKEMASPVLLSENSVQTEESGGLLSMGSIELDTVICFT